MVRPTRFERVTYGLEGHIDTEFYNSVKPINIKHLMTSSSLNFVLCTAYIICKNSQLMYESVQK
jgi:hypothetical protein